MNRSSLRIFFNVFLIILMISFILYAKEKGKIGTTKKNGEGCDCHGDANSKVTVIIDGPSDLKPNETADYTITISGGPMKTGGTNIAVSSGKLIEGEGLRYKGGELTHTMPQAFKDGKIVFKFKYTAPESAGEVTIFANGNSTNNDETKKGDAWNYAPNKVVTIMASN